MSLPDGTSCEIQIRSSPAVRRINQIQLLSTLALILISFIRRLPALLKLIIYRFNLPLFNIK